MPTRAVLFDFDGVIADTENVHVAAWQRTFGVMGWFESDETCARAAEIDDRAFVREVFDRRKIDGGDVDGWVTRKQDLTLQILAESPRLYLGVATMVEWLKARVRIGIVTTTWRSNVETILQASGLAGSFEFIIAKEDVRTPKPDPEGYRLALAKLSLPAADVLVVEDSPTGLEAARKAGLKTIAIGHRRPFGEWVGNSPYLPDFSNLDRALHELGLMD
jgi:beta-phosphoglucomutase